MNKTPRLDGKSQAIDQTDGGYDGAMDLPSQLGGTNPVNTLRSTPAATPAAAPEARRASGFWFILGTSKL